METYIGYIRSPHDALIIFEACRRGQLSRVQRRLSSKERIHIRSGSVFAWDEREAGMRRWTDGRTWSPSRVLGSFLTYRELDTKRKVRRVSPSSPRSPSLAPSSKAAVACSYKHEGLIKQSFSICTANNQKLHLISYYSKTDLLAGRLKQPSTDPLLSHITIPKGLYPELNPLDTSGGHSATIHNMRQQASMSPASTTDAHKTTCPPSPPPSLSSSSPLSLDEDMAPSSPQHYPLRYTSTSPPPPATNPTTTSLAYTLTNPIPCAPLRDRSSPHPASLPTLHTLLPIQDIPLDKLPSSEDRRQLIALHGQLRL